MDDEQKSSDDMLEEDHQSSEDMLADVQKWLTESSEAEQPDPPSEPTPARAQVEQDDDTATGPAPIRAPVTPPPPRREPPPHSRPERPSMWNRPGTWTVFGLVFAAIGAGVLALGLAQFAQSSSWEKTSGTITGVESGDDSLSIVIGYSVDGRDYSFESGTSDENPQLGEQTDILIDLANPANATTPYDRITALVLRTVFGGLVLIASPVPTIWGRNLARRATKT